MRVLTPAYSAKHRPQFEEALRANGLDPDRIYRIDLQEYAEGADATVYEYVIGDDGKPVLAEGERDVLRRPPYRVSLRVPLP